MSKKPNKNKVKKHTKKNSNSLNTSIKKEQQSKNTVAAVKNSNKAKVKKEKKNIFKKIVSFLKSTINEIKKIVWPTPKATFKSMAVVLVIVAIIGLFVFALDTGLLAILGKFMGIANS